MMMLNNNYIVNLSGKEANQVLNHLVNTISSKNFLSTMGLNNEIPFFICPYDITITKDMIILYKQLCKKLDQTEVNILEIDLYDICLEILKDNNLLDKILKLENTMQKNKIKDTLKSVLNPEKYLVPKILEKSKVSDFNVLFIKGVGEVFPYIRSHNVLNNLHSVIKEKPVVMFFPGTYEHKSDEGTTLDLFNLLKEDRYYRAFNILKIKGLL